jgi:hypothetical protein
MPNAQTRQRVTEFYGERIVGPANKMANDMRERALAAGLTVTTHKEGRLVQERLVAGKLVQLLNQVRE